MAILALPRGWSKRRQWGILNALSLARVCFMDVMSKLASSRRRSDRLLAENARLKQEVELLREEMSIKDARMSRVPRRRRPYYTPTERMRILQLKAMMVSGTTLSNWTGRTRSGDDEKLLQTSTPVNRFPDFVRYLIQVVKLICPYLGKVKIAEFLCRAGLHLSSSTVGRVLREPPVKKPDSSAERVLVVADRPNHVWHIDMTMIPITSGFTIPFGLFRLPQRWPFGWWIAVVLDQFSRRVLAFDVYRRDLSAGDVCNLIQRAMEATGERPDVVVSDGGGQFRDSFRAWCRSFGITPKRGRIGQIGSIAILDRAFRTIKQALRGSILVPFHRHKMLHEIQLVVDWYNSYRPHTSLIVCTPEEIYHGITPASQQPRVEPRPRWPRHSPCAAPNAPPIESPGNVHVKIGFLEGRKHLPIITLKHAA